MAEENGFWEEEAVDVSFEELGVSSDDDVVEAEIVIDETPDTTVTVPSHILDYNQAREITERIRAASDVLYVLIARAHAGQAWKALNYDSFESYVKQEFDISRSRAYQLVNQEKVVSAIESAAPEGTKIRITEAAARDLKAVLDEFTPRVKEATDGLSSEESEVAIDELINEFRSENRAGNSDLPDINPGGESYDEELAADRASRDGFANSSLGGNMGGGSAYGNTQFPVTSNGGGASEDDFSLEELGIDESELDAILDDTEETGESIEDIDDILGLSQDTTDVRRRFQAICDLYIALSSLSKMPPAEDIAPWVYVQEERRAQVESSLPKVQAWLNDFATSWQNAKNDADLLSDDSEESNGDEE